MASAFYWRCGCGWEGEHLPTRERADAQLALHRAAQHKTPTATRFEEFS